MKTKKILISILVIGFLVFTGYILFAEEGYTSASDLPTGYYTDQNVCRYTCSSTKCSATNPTGYCPSGQVCDGSSCQHVCSATNPTGYCPSGQVCDGSSCQAVCGTNTSFGQSLTGYCSDTTKVCFGGSCQPKCAIGGGYCANGLFCDTTDGQCKAPCGTNTSFGQSLTGYCNKLDPQTTQTCLSGVCTPNCSTTNPTGHCSSGTCDPDGTCRTPCSLSNTSGYCPSGQSCINGTCTTTYSCSNSCSPQRVIG